MVKFVSFIFFLIIIKGFEGTKMKGSAHNDLFINNSEKINSEIKLNTKTNYSGGILGGISNGENIVEFFFKFLGYKKFLKKSILE